MVGRYCRLRKITQVSIRDVLALDANGERFYSRKKKTFSLSNPRWRRQRWPQQFALHYAARGKSFVESMLAKLGRNNTAAQSLIISIDGRPACRTRVKKSCQNSRSRFSLVADNTSIDEGLAGYFARHDEQARVAPLAPPRPATHNPTRFSTSRSTRIKRCFSV